MASLIRFSTYTSARVVVSGSSLPRGPERDRNELTALGDHLTHTPPINLGPGTSSSSSSEEQQTMRDVVRSERGGCSDDDLNYSLLFWSCSKSRGGSRWLSTSPWFGGRSGRGAPLHARISRRDSASSSSLRRLAPPLVLEYFIADVIPSRSPTTTSCLIFFPAWHCLVAAHTGLGDPNKAIFCWGDFNDDTAGRRRRRQNRRARVWRETRA